MTLSPAALDAGIEALQREIAWRQAAERLELGEPDPHIARRHLLELVRLVTPRYLVGWFHRELCAKLEQFSRDVAAERSPRMLIAAPPRHGKSQIVSRCWPNWHLGNHPDHEVAVCSYGQELANDMSRDARAIRDRLVAEWADWAHLGAGDKDGVEQWKTLGGGGYKAVGAGGPLTGRGAHVLIIDDPFKNQEEAESETIREARWNWYTSSAYTRLAPGGGVLVMATRWHEDDLSGRLLEQLKRGEEPWEVVSFPAIAETDEPHRRAGEALHPARYPVAALERIRRVLGARAWSALYQQSPTPASGGMFQRAWMSKRFTHDPQRPPRPYDERVISVDATFKKSATSDYVSMHVYGRYGYATHHVLDEVRGRMSYPETRAALRDLARKWRPHAILVEEKANGAALVADLCDEIPGIIPFLPDKYGDKVTRAQLSSSWWAAGNFELPAGVEWSGDFVEEHVSFPTGTHDDRVDDCSQYVLWSHQRQHGTDRTALLDAVEGVLGGAGAEPEGLLDW